LRRSSRGKVKLPLGRHTDITLIHNDAAERSDRYMTVTTPIITLIVWLAGDIAPVKGCSYALLTSIRALNLF